MLFIKFINKCCADILSWCNQERRINASRTTIKRCILIRASLNMWQAGRSCRMLMRLEKSVKLNKPVLVTRGMPPSTESCLINGIRILALLLNLNPRSNRVGQKLHSVSFVCLQALKLNTVWQEKGRKAGRKVDEQEVSIAPVEGRQKEQGATWALGSLSPHSLDCL